MFMKRHFEACAVVLNDQREQAEKDYPETIYPVVGIYNAVVAFATLFTNDNERFDEAKFYIATGFSDWWLEDKSEE